MYILSLFLIDIMCELDLCSRRRSRVVSSWLELARVVSSWLEISREEVENSRTRAILLYSEKSSLYYNL